MMNNFNIKDYNQNFSFSHHSIHTEDLTLIANSLDLELSPLYNPDPTRYTNNSRDANLVLDLVFLSSDNYGFAKHLLFLDKRKLSNHVPMVIEVSIKKKDINITIQSIKKNSKAKKKFVIEIKENIKLLNIVTISNNNRLKTMVDNLALIFRNVQSKYAKTSQITKYSKEWQS